MSELCHCTKTKEECGGCPCRIGFAVYNTTEGRKRVPLFCDGTDPVTQSE